MITDSDIKALKHYFENRKDVAFAFLFGSQARILYRLQTINRPETIDYRLETLDNGKGIIIKRRGKWINF